MTIEVMHKPATSGKGVLLGQPANSDSPGRMALNRPVVRVCVRASSLISDYPFNANAEMATTSAEATYHCR